MNQNAIEAAVAPLKASAMDYAEKYARETAARLDVELTEFGHDLELAAPRGNSLRDDRVTYRTKNGRRALVNAVFSYVEKTHSGPHRLNHIVALDAAKVTIFVKHAREDAAATYEAYVRKLVKKIGAVKSATLDGSRVWTYSNLTVITEAGATETWKTQQILNVSVYGKVFNQWPTRQIGGTKRAVERKVRPVHFRSDDPASRKNYTRGFACAGSAMGAQRLLVSSDATADATKVTCSRCLKVLAARSAS